MNRSQFPRLFEIIVRILLYLLAFITILVVAGVVFFLSTLYTTGPPQEGYLALTGATVLLGEDLTPARIASVLSETTGRTIKHYQVPIEQVRESNEDFAAMLEWFDMVGYNVDIEANTEEFGITPTRFKDWAPRQDWS